MRLDENYVLILSVEIICWYLHLRSSVEIICWDYLLSLSVEISCWDYLLNCWDYLLKSAVEVMWWYDLLRLDVEICCCDFICWDYLLSSSVGVSCWGHLKSQRGHKTYNYREREREREREDSRIAGRQVPRPRCLSPLPIACIPGLLVARCLSQDAQGATTMIPQQSITKKHCLGSTRRFHIVLLFTAFPSYSWTSS